MRTARAGSADPKHNLASVQNSAIKVCVNTT